MTPQSVLIYGTACVLKGGPNRYAVERRDTGAVITQQPTRFLAVAKAAEVLRNPEPRRTACR